MVLICFSLMPKDVRHIFIQSLAICISFFVMCLLNFVCPFFYWIICSFGVVLSHLNTLGINLVGRVSNIFSLSV